MRKFKDCKRSKKIARKYFNGNKNNIYNYIYNLIDTQCIENTISKMKEKYDLYNEEIKKIIDPNWQNNNEIFIKLCDTQGEINFNDYVCYERSIVNLIKYKSTEDIVMYNFYQIDPKGLILDKCEIAVRQKIQINILYLSIGFQNKIWLMLQEIVL